MCCCNSNKLKNGVEIMPWCPKCKAEYQEGVTVCSDCGVELVESLEDAEILEPFFQAEDQKLAEKLVRFFEYSELRSEVHYDEENEVYVVSIPPKMQTQAKKLYQAFYYVEADLANKNAEKASSSDADEDEASDSELEAEDNSEDEDYEPEVPSDDITSVEKDHEERVYVMKADQYKDLAGTVWIFLAFGIVGTLVVILNIIGVFDFISGLIPTIVMGALFLSFLYIALSTNQKAKKVQAEIDAENQLTEKINEWLKLHVTEEFLDSLHNSSISEELNFIKIIDTIKELLIKEFGPQNLAYLDRLIDEFYSSTFDREEA
jgi:transcription initiation factor TFIIIB Brf1 subunit/transcription initiation factor TFIIB